MNKECGRAIGWLAAGLAGLLLCCCPGQQSSTRSLRFSRQPLDINDYYLFDLGIVDADGDRNLDIFTSNHTALASLLLGDGKGRFRDVYAEWGLSEQPEFPGLEDAWTAPSAPEEGVHIYWHRRRLIIKASLATGAAGFSGRLVTDAEVAVVESAGWRCAIDRGSPSLRRTRTALDFRLEPGRLEGTLVLAPELPEVPQTLTFAKTTALDSIFIGSNKLHPERHTFRLALKDRHGLAWADRNGDGRPALFIAGGGVSGRIADFPEVRPYELLMRSGSGLADAASGLNLLNNGARPRQATWVDVDGDGLLELFVYGIWSRSQLFKQAPGGGFADIARESGIQSTVNGLSAWFDADADADPDLLVSARDEFVLYLNEKGLFREIRLGRNPHGLTGAPPEYRQFGRPAFADFDGDGDIDIFVASANGSTLILNLGGTFRLEEPGARGLPSRAAAAAWVDADNDSLPDLQSVPDGLFLQTRGHRFERTGLLACDSAEPIAAGRCLWFDADNDGDRDVIISLLPRDGETARLWSSRFFLNGGSGRHWVEVAVVGPPGNRDGIGARVVVELGDGRRLTDYVGLAEGSTYSQGHYRLYFGLGKSGPPRAVSVRWPDGLTERVPTPAPDRLMIFGRGLGRREPGDGEVGSLR